MAFLLSTGVAVTYDKIGNPLNDGTWTYTWEKGRQLARMQSVDTDVSFVYNENGLRVQKTANGVVTDYTLHGKNIVHMTQGENELHFFYDAQNRPAIVVYNGVPYGYVKNLQGDVVALLDNAGAVVVKYVYDAWGRPISKTGTLASTLGTVQPFRYRGYVYDEETGLYYLRSRFYSHSQCRFLNADSDLLASKSAYCYGNSSAPNIADPNGTDAVWITSYWYLGPLTIPFGHTSLLIEDEQTGQWYYTMYAKNAVILKTVPDSYMDSLSHFNEYLDNGQVLGLIDRAWCDYTSATYIEGDFSEALSYYRKLRTAFLNDNIGVDATKRKNKDYDLFTNNCVTLSLDLLEMGITPEGEKMKTWMEDQCKEYCLQYPASFIPNCNTHPIAEIFGNTSFTKPEE